MAFPRLSDEPPIIVHRSLLQAFGPVGACVLAQIHFWSHSKGKGKWIDGERWADATLSDFADALGLNLRTVQRAITKLEGDGAIESTRGANKAYRVTGTTRQNGMKNMPKADVEHATLSRPYIEEETKETVERALPSEVQPTTPSAMVQITPERRPQVVLKIVKNKPAGQPKLPTTSAAALATLQQRVTKREAEVPPNSKDSAKLLWQKAPKFNPDMAQTAPVVGTKDVALLKKIVDGLGPTTDRDLRYVLSNWLKFTEHAQDQKGLWKGFKVPTVPQLGFIVMCLNEVKSFGEKMEKLAAEEAEFADDKPMEAATIAPSSEDQPVTTTTPPTYAPLPEKDQPISIEEMEAYEAGTLKLPK
jgi:DNA-binding transcriptional regulator YhcF (GntR family)